MLNKKREPRSNLGVTAHFTKDIIFFNNEYCNYIYCVLIPCMAFYRMIICTVLFILSNDPIRQNYVYVQFTYEKK